MQLTDGCWEQSCLVCNNLPGMDVINRIGGTRVRISNDVVCFLASNAAFYAAVNVQIEYPISPLF